MGIKTSILKRRVMNKGLILLLILFIACQGNTYYHSYQPVSNAGWKRNDTLFYHLPSITKGEYNLQIGIRHLESYPYKDIWLEVCHNLQDSTIFQKDTLHLYLADSLGDWQGKGIGGLLQYTEEAPLKVEIKESHSNASIHITHLMSDSLLRSIYDVGIQVNHIR